MEIVNTLRFSGLLVERIEINVKDYMNHSGIKKF